MVTFRLREHETVKCGFVFYSEKDLNSKRFPGFTLERLCVSGLPEYLKCIDEERYEFRQNNDVRLEYEVFYNKHYNRPSDFGDIHTKFKCNWFDNCYFLCYDYKQHTIEKMNKLHQLSLSEEFKDIDVYWNIEVVYVEILCAASIRFLYPFKNENFNLQEINRYRIAENYWDPIHSNINHQTKIIQWNVNSMCYRKLIKI
jgi:hypothetical protein